jgi:hypothetical protein
MKNVIRGALTYKINKHLDSCRRTSEPIVCCWTVDSVKVG